MALQDHLPWRMCVTTDTLNWQLSVTDALIGQPTMSAGERSPHLGCELVGLALAERLGVCCDSEAVGHCRRWHAWLHVARRQPGKVASAPPRCLCHLQHRVVDAPAEVAQHIQSPVDLQSSDNKYSAPHSDGTQRTLLAKHHTDSC